MRKSFAIATFVVAGAGVVGVGALNMNGSDTLHNVTNEMVLSFNGGAALCPGATSITYLGGGSGAGENAMLAGNQAIAPMSRFLGTAVCKGVNDAGVPTTANGLVVALDGLAIVGSASQAGTTACNGTTGGDTASSCSVAAGVPIDPTIGLASNTTVTFSGGTYTFNSWKDVLSVLFMGKDHTGTVNCNSALRNFLANNWASVFESTGCTSTTCTQIRHLFRRDDASGTTDIFSQLLGFSGPSATGGSAVSAAVATANGIAAAWHFGSDAFCNTTTNAGAPFNATVTGDNPGGENAAAGVVPNDNQDSDPIRRPCANGRTSEQVCERGTFDPINACSSTVACPTGETCFGTQCWSGGSLGLVLPVVTTNTLGTDQYHVNACNTVIQVKAPLVPSGRGTAGGNCPNGDVSAAAGNLCFVPADGTVTPANPNCLATNAQPPQLSTGTSQANSGNGPDPRAIDSRAFNKSIWKLNADGSWSQAVDDSGRPMYGAYYRIHSTSTLASGALTCQDQDATDQIGCLAQASPCSFGYAGKEAASFTTGVTAMKVLGVPPVTACVQALGQATAYKISRKLYLDSISGFQTATAAEQALAVCESTVGTINQAVDFEHFVELPDSGPNAVNGGSPFCEDFNEQLLCGAAANVNGCAANSAVTGLPTVSTTCGNGTVEAFEECDPAATSGGLCAASVCSTSCRCPS